MGMFRTQKISTRRALEQLEVFFEAECYQIWRKIEEFREGRSALQQGCQSVNSTTLFHQMLSFLLLEAELRGDQRERFSHLVNPRQTVNEAIFDQ